MTTASKTFASLRAVPHQQVDKDGIYLAVAMYRLAQTDEGKLLLAWLDQKYTRARVPADASDSALRMMEGSRQVPADLERLIERGGRESTPK